MLFRSRWRLGPDAGDAGSSLDSGPPRGPGGEDEGSSHWMRIRYVRFQCPFPCVTPLGSLQHGARRSGWRRAPSRRQPVGAPACGGPTTRAEALIGVDSSSSEVIMKLQPRLAGYGLWGPPEFDRTRPDVGDPPERRPMVLAAEALGASIRVVAKLLSSCNHDFPDKDPVGSSADSGPPRGPDGEDEGSSALTGKDRADPR